MALDLGAQLDYDNYTLSFIAADSTAAKILVDVQIAKVMAAISGETAIPYNNAALEFAARQRLLLGGFSLLGGRGSFIGSTDGSAKSVLLYPARLASTMGNGTGTITSQNLITRNDGGSYLTDGWRRGDSVFMFGTATAANEGVMGIVTTVTALVLTVNGTPYTNDGALTTGTRLVRAGQGKRIAVPANSGNSDTIANVALLGGTYDPSVASLPDTGWTFGASGMILAAMVAATSALPAQVNLFASIART